MRTWCQRAVLAGLALLAAGGPVRAEEIPVEYRAPIKRGLDWLARNQTREGKWEGVNGGYAISMTGVAGMAFLVEGSTIREGKYRENIKRATTYLMERVQPSGLIGVPTSATEGGRYMYGHGFALMFL